MRTEEAPGDEVLGVDSISVETVTLVAPMDTQPEPPVGSPTADLVSVVVPAMNEEQFIGPCLDSILSQDHHNLQVLVVDGGSTDGTTGVVQRYAALDPRVQCLSSPGKTIPGSLNIGLQAAEGRWFVRVDAHSTVSPGYISRLVEHLRTGQWGGVGGRKDGVATSSRGGAIAAALSSRFGVGNSTYHYGTSMQVVDHVPFGAYPTSLLRRIGGWDETLHANEDFELDYRLRRQGQRLLFDPNVVIAWQNRQTLGELFGQYRRYGRGKARVAMLHPRSIEARHLATPALLCSWVVAAALAFRWPWLLLVVVPYAAALLFASAITSRNAQGQAGRLDIAAAFLAMHVAWGIGFWEGVFAEIARRLRARIRL